MTIVPATAEEKLVITESNIQELDKFVSVQNNQFVLEIPEYVIIDDALKATYPIAGVTVTDIVDSLITEGIKDGVEMHYNFFLFKVKVIKPQ